MNSDATLLGGSVLIPQPSASARAGRSVVVVRVRSARPAALAATAPLSGHILACFPRPPMRRIRQEEIQKVAIQQNVSRFFSLEYFISKVDEVDEFTNL